LLAGWFLYFRSVFSASAYSGDLAFILNNLNSIRYVDGELAVSELFLLVPLSFSPWLAVPFVALNLVSRLAILYAKLDTFAPAGVVAIAIVVLAAFFALGRRVVIPALAVLVVSAPFILERNRLQWTAYWNDLKPEIRAHAGPDLAELALTDGGYFAGHVVAAGSPMNPVVRSLLPEDVEALPAATRPQYLVVLVTPGSEAATTWESRYGMTIAAWGYRKLTPGKFGALYEK
jgi:hypothetical protein